MLETVCHSLYTEKDKPRVLSKAYIGLAETQQVLGALGQQVDQHDARIEHLRMVRLGRALLLAFADHPTTSVAAAMPTRPTSSAALWPCCATDQLSGWAQLLRYRAAVRAAQPGQAVRCAFVVGDGRVVEIA